MRVTLVHNPSAGGGQPSITEILDTLKRTGYEAEHWSTKELNAALEHPGDIILIAGGDGTVEHVSRRLVGRSIPIGLLPLGTANNVATSLGINGSIEEIISGWDLNRRKAFDVGYVQTPWGETYFIESVGLGLFPHAMSMALARDEELDIKERDDELSTAFRLIGDCVTDHESRTYSMTVDGTALSGDYLLVEVMNTDWIGPNLRLGGGADPGDGWLHLVVARPEHRTELIRYFRDHQPMSKEHPPIEVRRGKHIEIVWTGSKLHVDDSIWPEADVHPHKEPSVQSPEIITIEVKPGALEFLVPG